jgi:antitoxin (DNA-binding transcriptional repressor) of toxin-antitoxin stability system
MKTVSVADFKSRFSDLIRLVRNGERIAICYGRRKETVAYLVPPPSQESGRRKRPLGILKGKARFRIKGNFKISPEEMVGG